MEAASAIWRTVADFWVRSTTTLALGGDVAAGIKRGAVDFQLLEVRAVLGQVDDLVDAHLVGGEGAGLVGADDAAAAERLNGRQAAHDSVLGGHLAGA